MLAIKQKFPVNKMVLYGSTAFVVGFAGMLATLHEFAPKDAQDDDTVLVDSGEKRTVTNNVKNQSEKGAKAPAANAASDALTQSGLTVRKEPVAAQPNLYAASAAQSPRVNAPVSTSSPTVAPAPRPATSTTGATQPAHTATSPSSPAPPSQSADTSLLQGTISDVTGATDIILKP